MMATDTTSSVSPMRAEILMSRQAKAQIPAEIRKYSSVLGIGAVKPSEVKNVLMKMEVATVSAIAVKI